MTARVRRVVALAGAVLLACALLLALPAASLAADDDASEEEALGLVTHLYKLAGSSQADEDGLVTESVGAVFPSLLGIVTTPSSISTGIACQNMDVCEVDPCTCGKPDAWGHCACGGYEDTSPTVVITSSDSGVARAVSAFGRVWVVPISPGTATIEVSAELVHYQSALYTFEVAVQPLGALDVALVAAAAVLLAALVIVLALLVRLLVRAVRALAARARKRKERGKALQQAHPITWKAQGAPPRRRARGKRPARRHPFLHDFFLALRGALPVLLAGLAAFAVLVPASTTVIDDVSVFNVDYTHEQLKYQLYDQDLGFAVNAAAVLYGAVLAVALFRFLLEKRATTAYFSVGLSRMKLFFARYLAGVLCLLLGIGVPFAASFALNCAALGCYDGFVHEALYVACGYLLVALVAFSLAVIAVSRAGTLFEACMFSALLLLGVSVLLWGVGVLAECLLVGNAAGAALYNSDTLVEPSFLSSLSWLNPVLFFAAEGAQHQYFMALHPVYYPEYSSPALLVGWLAALLALCAAGLLCFCRRRGEQAEMAGKAPVLALCSVAVCGLAAFAAAVALVGPLDVPIALVAGAALFVLVSLVLLFGPLRGRTARRVTLACVAGELVAMAAVVAVLASGAFGYASYVPQTDDVESVEVSYVGSPSYLTESFAGVASDNSYYYTSMRTYYDASSVDIVCGVHSQLVATARSEWATDYDTFGNTVVPYDVVIRYTLADGSEVTRYYSQASVDELSSLLSLDNDEHSTLLETAAITGSTEGLSDEEAEALSDSPSYNAYQSGSIYLGDGALNRIIAVDIGDEERAELLQALASDLAGLTAAQRYAPEYATQAVLMFTLSPETDVASFGYSFSNAVSYVTQEWTATMAWLEENGYLDALGGELDPLVIESLTLQLDDPYASINEVTAPVSRYFMAYRTETSSSFWVTQDYGSLTVIDDSATIAALVPELRTGCYMTGGYLVEAKLRGIEAYVYFYLPADAAAAYL